MSGHPEKHWRYAAAVVLGLLVASGAAVAMARVADGYAWLACFGLIPLFLCIAKLRPLAALAAGTIWGASLGITTWALGGPDGLSAAALAALIAGVGLYTAGGAWVTRRIGFRPFVLAVGWILLEIVIAPLGARQGILAAALIGEPSLASAVAHALGYVFVAFLVAYLNALLLAAIHTATARLGGVRPPVSGAARPLAAPSLVLVHRDPASRPGSPRAPPA